MAERNGEEEEGRACSVCGEVPESIIFLGCAHAVCLMCAGRTVFEAGGGAESVDCPLCALPTALSPELQEALRELLASDQSGGEESAPETSALGGGAEPSLAGEQPLRLPCPAHAGEEAVYYRAADHRLLCPQCALAAGGAGLAGLRPLRRCLPQVLAGLREPFRRAELEAKRLGLLCAEAEFRRQALAAEAEARQRRAEGALDEVVELATALKAAAARDFRARLDAELERLSAVEERLRQRRDAFRAAARQADALRESAGAEKLSAAFAAAERLQRQLAEEGAPPSSDALLEKAAQRLSAWTAAAGEQARRALSAKLSLALGDGPPSPAPPGELRATTAFHFRPAPNALLARLNERARGRDPPAERSPLKPPCDALSAATLSSRAGSALKSRRETPLAGRALAYSALKRRELDAKLQLFHAARQAPFAL